MFTVLPVKVTLKDLQFQNFSLSVDKLSLIISSSSLKNVYKYPFEEMALHLINFPKDHFLSLTLLSENSAVLNTEIDISGLEHKEVLLSEVTLCETHENNPKEPENILRGIFQVARNRDTSDEVEIPFLDEEYSDLNLSTLKIALNLANNAKEGKYEISDFLRLDCIELKDFQEITPQTIKNIRYLLLGINEKLKVLDILKEKLKEYEDKYFKELVRVANMKEQFRKTCLGFLSDKKESEKQVSQLENRIKDLLLKLKNQDEQRILFEEFKVNKEIEIENLKLQIEELSKRKIHSIEIPEEKLLTKEENLQYSVSDEVIKIIKDLSEENEDLRSKLKKSYEKNCICESEINEIKQEVIFLTSKMIEYEIRSDYNDEMQSQYSRMERDLKHFKESYESLQSHLKKVSEDYIQTTKELYSEKQEITEQNKKLSQEHSEIKTELITLQNKYFELQSKSYNNSHVNTTSYTLLTEQNRQLLEDSKNFCQLTNDLELKLIQDNSLMVISFLDVSENYLLLQRLLNSILLFLRDKELENGLLRESCKQIQKQKVAYVPIRNDYIDNQLANFINSSPVPIEVPFVRVDNGIYLFGTKRVVLRVENIGISIRVGGGYITLEDFISNQTQFEVGKMKERLEKAKRSMPVSPLYTSPEPQDIERIGSPKFMMTSKKVIPKSPKGLPEKKTSLNQTVKLTGRRVSLI